MGQYLYTHLTIYLMTNKINIGYIRRIYWICIKISRHKYQSWGVKKAASLGHPLMFLGQARYRSIKRFKNLLRLSFLILITIIKRWIKRWMMQGISRYIRVTNIYCYLPSHQDGGHLSHDNSLSFPFFSFIQAKFAFPSWQRPEMNY